MSEHRIAVSDYSGHIQVVKADEIRVCVPTIECMRFWVTSIICLIGIGAGLLLMLWSTADSGFFKAGEAIAAMAMGILIPGPDYSSVLPKRKRKKRRPASPSPNNHNGGTPRPPPQDGVIEIGVSPS